MKKINLDNDYKKQNYQLNIEVMEKNLEMLQSSCDTITAQRDMAEDNLTKFSHNAQKNKKNYELCIESLKNELCTKTNDLINSLEEKDDLLEETSNQKKIIYNLKSKLQHEHEKFQQLEERNLECMERKEATFKQLHEDMNYDNLEYKDKNIKLKIEITILIDNNNNLVSQLNEEKSRFKIKEVEAIANKVLSKGVEENLQSKILKNKKILFLSRQRREALAKLKVKPLFCNQAIEDWKRPNLNIERRRTNSNIGTDPIIENQQEPIHGEESSQFQNQFQLLGRPMHQYQDLNTEIEDEEVEEEVTNLKPGAPISTEEANDGTI
uniref:Uncharacterized protein n=1 Tax=Physcomitrium patens TaxID=3218 RepID=A0A2K1KT97_PHYPA|nr:hypothetical protein PHYPA_004008 [Physcomitrium patens]